MTASGGTPPLWVVVPACDEETGTGATLAALASQTGTGFVPVVDNASTGANAVVVRRFTGVVSARRNLLRQGDRRYRTAYPKQVHVR